MVLPVGADSTLSSPRSLLTCSGNSLRDVRYLHSVCCYRSTRVMRGTEIAYGRAFAFGCAVLRWRMAGRLPLRDGRLRGSSRRPFTCYPPTLCSTMSGTDIAHGAIGLNAWYGVSGTDIAYPTII
eukprot:3940628-Rhodomonas_salina.3